MDTLFLNRVMELATLFICTPWAAEWVRMRMALIGI